MKLIFCPVCSDVVKLKAERIPCECGHSWGLLAEDGIAEIAGEAIPFGITDSSLIEAYKNYHVAGSGMALTSFVYPGCDVHLLTFLDT